MAPRQPSTEELREELASDPDKEHLREAWDDLSLKDEDLDLSRVPAPPPETAAVLFAMAGHRTPGIRATLPAVCFLDVGGEERLVAVPNSFPFPLLVSPLRRWVAVSPDGPLDDDAEAAAVSEVLEAYRNYTVDALVRPDEMVRAPMQKKLDEQADRIRAHIAGGEEQPLGYSCADKFAPSSPFIYFVYAWVPDMRAVETENKCPLMALLGAFTTEKAGRDFAEFVGQELGLAVRLRLERRMQWSSGEVMIEYARMKRCMEIEKRNEEDRVRALADAEQEASSVDFEAAAEFSGKREGWEFKTGEHGTGYYKSVSCGSDCE